MKPVRSKIPILSNPYLLAGDRVLGEIQVDNQALLVLLKLVLRGLGEGSLQDFPADARQNDDPS